MTFTLEQLRGFVAVAEELHFGRAAERLQITQPPLSRQLQKLERGVGVRLVERDNRRVVLTPAGEAFLGEARRLLSLAEAAPELARRVSSGSTGVVRIGFTAASTYGTLGRLLNVIAQELPEVDIGLHEMVTREQVVALLREEVDLGLARPPFDSETFASQLVQREAILVALPPGHQLGLLGRPVNAGDLADEALIMHSPVRAQYFYDLVVSLIPVAHENVVHTVSQVLTMLWLVAAGRGVAFVPESAARLGVPGVEFARLDSPVENPVELHLLWSRTSRNPALSEVLRVLHGGVPTGRAMP